MELSNILGFRFKVSFVKDGEKPNNIDTRFQKVSGLSAEVRTTTVTEGGQNLYTHRLPERIDYQNLVLERGIVVDSPLNEEFDTVMTLFEFHPSNVFVELLDKEENPVSCWHFIQAYPVKWSTSDLDAKENSILIDTLELAYTRMQIMRI